MQTRRGSCVLQVLGLNSVGNDPYRRIHSLVRIFSLYPDTQKPVPRFATSAVRTKGHRGYEMCEQMGNNPANSRFPLADVHLPDVAKCPRSLR